MSMYHRKEVPVALDLDSGEATTRGPTYQEAKMMHTREACKDNQSVWDKAKNEYLLHRHIRVHEESKTTESLVTTVLLVLSVAAVSRAAVNWCTCVSESGAVATTRMNHADSLKSYKINTDNKLVKMFEERGRKYGFTDIDVDDMCSVYYVPPGAEMPPDGKGTGDNSPLINGILGNLRAAVVEERPEDYREWHKQHARKYEQWRERPEAMDQHLEAHPLEDVYERASPKHAAEAFHTAMQAYPASVIVIGNKTVVISTQGDRLVVSDHLTDNSARHTEVHNGKTWSSDGKHTPWWISKEFIKDMEDQLLVYSTKEKKEQLTANELRMRDLYERLLSEERKFASEDEMQKAKDMAEVMKKEGDEVNSSSIISPFLSGIKGFGHLNLNPRVGAEISISI